MSPRARVALAPLFSRFERLTYSKAPGFAGGYLLLKGADKEKIRQAILEKVNSLDSLVRKKQFLQETARISKVLDAKSNFDFLDSLCEQVHNDLQSFQLWFDHSLNDEDRMLVIGLSAFYGMSAEQTFAMLDRVVDEVWRPRRSSLPYYDYGDIQRVSTHFEVIGHNIELKNDRFPNAVFKYCWEKYRRLLTTLLPIAVKVSKESFELHKKESRGLFGTKVKKEKLRATISLFLSRIASLDFEATKEHLVDLITSKNDGAVSIAAHVIAYVYRDGDSNFKNEIDCLLYDWLDKNSENYEHMMRLLKEELVHKDDRETIPESRLQVLLAYTLMYIFKQYSSNTVPERLKQLLLDLIENSSAEVHKKVGSTVLPSVYSAHFDQFYDKIEWLADKNTLQEAVAILIEKNFTKHHESIWKLLESWFTSPLEMINQNESLENKKLILTSLKVLERIYKLDKQANSLDKSKIIDLINDPRGKPSPVGRLSSSSKARYFS